MHATDGFKITTDLESDVLLDALGESCLCFMVTKGLLSSSAIDLSEYKNVALRVWVFQRLASSVSCSYCKQ